MRRRWRIRQAGGGTQRTVSARAVDEVNQRVIVMPQAFLHIALGEGARSGARPWLRALGE